MLDAQLRREIVLTTENRTGLLAEISRLLGDISESARFVKGDVLAGPP